jgi:hypothetical protein
VAAALNAALAAIACIAAKDLVDCFDHSVIRPLPIGVLLVTMASIYCAYASGFDSPLPAAKLS